MNDAFDLARFALAQNPVYESVCAELRSGSKRGHWMWFMFPQIEGLGRSPLARKYAISSRAEAAAYLEHPVLGPRLRECTALVNAVTGQTATGIFGSVDALKFRSSMTLFAEVAGGENVFTDALQKYFEGKPDPLTLERL